MPSNLPPGCSPNDPHFYPEDPPECPYHHEYKEWDVDNECWACPQCRTEDEEETHDA